LDRLFPNLSTAESPSLPGNLQLCFRRLTTAEALPQRGRRISLFEDRSKARSAGISGGRGLTEVRFGDVRFGDVRFGDVRFGHGTGVGAP
jgi:hypothetical protein